MSAKRPTGNSAWNATYELVHGNADHVLGDNDGAVGGVSIVGDISTSRDVSASGGNLPRHGVDLAWTSCQSPMPTKSRGVHLDEAYLCGRPHHSGRQLSGWHRGQLGGSSGAGRRGATGTGQAGRTGAMMGERGRDADGGARRRGEAWLEDGEAARGGDRGGVGGAVGVGGESRLAGVSGRGCRQAASRAKLGATAGGGGPGADDVVGRSPGAALAVAPGPPGPPMAASVAPPPAGAEPPEVDGLGREEADDDEDGGDDDSRIRSSRDGRALSLGLGLSPSCIHGAVPEVPALAGSGT